MPEKVRLLFLLVARQDISAKRLRTPIAAERMLLTCFSSSRLISCSVGQGSGGIGASTRSSFIGQRSSDRERREADVLAAPAGVLQGSALVAAGGTRRTA